MERFLYIVFIAITFVSCQRSLNEHDQFLEQLMRQHPEKFSHILEHRDSLEVQIIYTQINRDEHNNPFFQSYYFNVDSSRYFYPASTVKLPVVLMALEKLSAMNKPGVTKYTTMLHDSVYAGQQTSHNDTSAANGLPSLAHYIKKILLVSDNNAYNRLYEFVGQREINENLKRKGFTETRIVHRLERPLSADENSHTEAISFLDDNNMAIYKQPMLVNDQPLLGRKKILKGMGFIRRDSLIKQPFDFTEKNLFPLNEQQWMLRNLIFPAALAKTKPFNLSEEDRAFVLKYMSQLPGETDFPAYYRDTTYYDAYCKFLMFGNDHAPIPTNIRIFNKVGDAYGYMIDNAYIVDFENKVEFLLSAVINTNTDGIYNDGKYEYETLGFPFMQNIGQVIYHYELKRNRKYSPDLSAFVFQYNDRKNLKKADQ